MSAPPALWLCAYADGVNVRAAPSTDATVLGFLRPGDIVEELEASGRRGGGGGDGSGGSSSEWVRHSGGGWSLVRNATAEKWTEATTIFLRRHPSSGRCLGGAEGEPVVFRGLRVPTAIDEDAVETADAAEGKERKDDPGKDGDSATPVRGGGMWAVLVAGDEHDERIKDGEQRNIGMYVATRVCLKPTWLSFHPTHCLPSSDFFTINATRTRPLQLLPYLYCTYPSYLTISPPLTHSLPSQPTHPTISPLPSLTLTPPPHTHTSPRTGT